MALRILSYPGNHRVFKAQIAGKYNGVVVEAPAFNFGTDNKTPEFLKTKNPLGKVPVLETPDGPVFESNAIVRHVGRLGKNRLYGNTPYEGALVDQWIDFTANEIELPAAAWLYPIMGFIPNNPEATQKAKGDIRKSLGVLNDYLNSRTFLVNERVSLADIVLSTGLLRLYEMVLDPGFRKGFANVNRWFLTCMNQPEFKAVIPEVKLCEKMQVAKEAAPAPAAAHAAEKPKEKPAEKPKVKPAEKPKKKEEEDDGGDDDENEEDKKPKTKNPLDLLPPSTFVLDEWKRTYSNNDTKSVAIPWFWEHFDPQGYSVWFCDYKYNNELKMLFMTSNLVTGFLQRLDKLRKYGFGTVLIFGGKDDGQPLSISGLFIVRGQEIPPELSRDCDDFELYNWTRADLKGDKNKIEEFLHWEGDFGGRGKPSDGKSFK